MSSEPVTFHLPPPEGFQPTQASCELTSNQIEADDKQLWFIRAPKDFPLEQFNNLKLSLDFTKSPVCSFEINNRKYFIRSESEQEVDQMFNGIPQTDGTLTMGKPFAKNLQIVEEMSSVPAYAEKRPDDWELPAIPEPKGLKTRYYPSGYVKPEEKALPEIKNKKEEKKEEKKESPKKVEKREKVEKKKKSKKSKN
ncbi:hypothetical protein WA158_004052 [Blastocystis sp. Blastoise]